MSKCDCTSVSTAAGYSCDTHYLQAFKLTAGQLDKSLAIFAFAVIRTQIQALSDGLSRRVCWPVLIDGLNKQEATSNRTSQGVGFWATVLVQRKRPISKWRCFVWAEQWDGDRIISDEGAERIDLCKYTNIYHIQIWCFVAYCCICGDLC